MINYDTIIIKQGSKTNKEIVKWGNRCKGLFNVCNP